VPVHGYPVLAAALQSQMAARAYRHRDDDYADGTALVYVVQVRDSLVRVAREVAVPRRAVVLLAQQYDHAAVNCCGAQVISSPQR
jgi:hypothetical protein